MTIELKQKQKRLTSGKKGCYDKVGNREQVTENAITTTYKPNLLNQYDTINGAWLKYDNNGNLTKYQSIEYTYDAQNRLLSVNSNNNPIITFTYDGRNRCIKRVINGTTNYLYYDNWDLIEEYDASNNLLASYFHGNWIDEILSKTTSTNQIYYHYDDLGSITHLSDFNGNIIEKYVYDPFGKPTILNATNGIISFSAYNNRFLFVGREYIKEARLYDCRNRIYSSELGRFLQVDPIGFSGGINFYHYCHNNPINWEDAFGLKDVYIGIEGDLVGIVGAEAGAGIVIDTDHLGESGLYGTIGGAGGANVGYGIGVGFTPRDIEGLAVNGDVNVGRGSFTASMDDKGFNGGGFSLGPGLGASTSTTYTGTYSINKLIEDIKELVDKLKKKSKEEKDPCQK